MITGSITLHYITCNLKNVRLQITFDYMKNVIDYNRLRLQITITPCLTLTHSLLKEETIFGEN
jgi:hypothetical protein